MVNLMILVNAYSMLLFCKMRRYVNYNIVWDTLIVSSSWAYIDDSVQERCNSIANALELRPFCTNSSI